MLLPFGENDPVLLFWHWFAENKDWFNNMEEDKEQKLQILLGELKNIKEGFAVEISSESDGYREIVISADGDLELFPFVEEIIEKAPEIEGWKTIGFRQRQGCDFTITAGKLILDPSEMFFEPVVENHELNMIIYVKGIRDHDQLIVAYYCLLVMDVILGEFDCVTKVGHYDFFDLDTIEDRSNLIPLCAAADFVDKYYAAENN
jgi:hypothetical protein